MKVTIHENEIDRLWDLIDNNMVLSAKAIEETAKKECPVRTGKLKDDIASDYDDVNKVAYIYNTLDYAPYVNLGTKKMAANPYLEKGLYGTSFDNIW